MNVGVVGLGEAGMAIATELLHQGHVLSCLDTRPGRSTATRAAGAGLASHDSASSFAKSIAAVLVTVPASVALEVAHEVVPHLPASTFYADCTAKTPALRDAVADTCRSRGVRFADVALMDTVTWGDRPVDVLVSGTGAAEVARLFDGTRLRATILDPERPISAEVKLARSIFTKGLSALLLETFTIGKRAGALPVIEQSITRFMREDFERIVALLVGTAPRHAKRRSDEMADAVRFAEGSGGTAPMTNAAATVLAEVARLRAASGPAVPDEWRAVIEWLQERGFLGGDASHPLS